MYICILFVVVVVVVVVVLYYISSNLGFQYLPVQTMLAVFWSGGPVLFSTQYRTIDEK